MKNSGFKDKPRKPMKRSGFKQKETVPMKKTRLKMRGTSEVSVLKEQIQALLRKIVIHRDGGCILRHYGETGPCGGRRGDGELVLQAEHLHTRSNSASYADHRLVVCLCQSHHIFWKPQYSDQYYQIVKRHIGEERTKLLKAVQEDRGSHKMDWQIEKLALEQFIQENKI